jgi:hypothetical protein
LTTAAGRGAVRVRRRRRLRRLGFWGDGGAALRGSTLNRPGRGGIAWRRGPGLPGARRADSGTSPSRRRPEVGMTGGPHPSETASGRDASVGHNGPKAEDGRLGCSARG